MGLTEIKCPKSKQFMSPEELLKDENFYMCSLNGFPELKEYRSHGYYSQIQMAMGLCGLSFCDFLVYTFKGMIISRTLFDPSYFEELLTKLNNFYKKYMLPLLANK